MKTILIADDHQMFADGLQFILSYTDHYKLVGIVQDGTKVLPFLRTQQVNVLLLDINMPGLSGIEVAHLVRKEFPYVLILAVSMQNDYQSVQAMLRAGVNGYCLKSAGKDELLLALDRIKQGEQYLSKEITQVLLNGQKKPTFHEFEQHLTPREIEIVRLIAKGRSNVEIAEQLFVSHRTIETHRKNIYSKLNLHNTAELTAYAMKHGYFDQNL